MTLIAAFQAPQDTAASSNNPVLAIIESLSGIYAARRAYMRRLAFASIVVCCIAFLSGCGGGNGGSGPAVSLTGSWNFSDNISNASIQVSCQSTGTVNINQSNSSFNGTYSVNQTFTEPDGTINRTVSATIGGVQ